MKRGLLTLGIVGLLGGGVYIFYTELRPVVIFGLRDDFAQAIPFQQVPEGIDSLKAESCGKCHQAIYEEWKTSIHAQAFDDPFFQAYWKRDNNIWICLNCHTPLENQQPELIIDIPRDRVEKAVKMPNPNYDPEFQHEGITCAACHVRDGVILGPYEDSDAPHPTMYDPIYRSMDLCYRCHQVPSGPFQFYRAGPCGTYPEFEGEHYFNQGYICQTCHMPAVERPVATGGPMRKGRKHLWRGGHDPEQVKRAITIKLTADPPELPSGQEVEFLMEITNSGAGHKLPTGDPDRHFTFDFEIVDQAGNVLEAQSHTMGRWILWQPVIWEVWDNRLKPLQSRNYRFRYRMPQLGGAEGPITLRTVVTYHIQTDAQNQMLRDKYGLTGNDPYNFPVFEREIPLSGPFPETVEGTYNVNHAELVAAYRLGCHEDNEQG
ncbi:MAG: hypothetical protein CMH81_00515 [Nitrospiraceae bacterium]|nr:hypothetical protein [Nitrospiraceae bacterium]